MEGLWKEKERKRNRERKKINKISEREKRDI